MRPKHINDEAEAVREAEFWLTLRAELMNGHPNPKRIGCPRVASLEHAAKARYMRPAVSAHLFSCSPCYRVYSRFLRIRLMEFRKAQSQTGIQAGTKDDFTASDFVS